MDQVDHFLVDDHILASPEEAKKMAELKKKLSLPAISGGGEEAEWEIQAEEERIEATARSELVHLAWQKRNIATGVWVSLVAISAVMAAILFKQRTKPEDQHNPSL